MIDPQGHIVLTGFGHAECRSLNTGSGRAGSFSDLGESQPPELILGWKHDFAVDCWSFGILLFIMQVGRVSAVI
jgi:serum/glucocorticoid-regulated kinase 2